MANTEGIPDEILPSLFSTTPSPVASSIRSKTSSGSSNSRKNRLARRDEAMALQQQQQQQHKQQQQKEIPKFPRNKQRERLMNEFDSSLPETTAAAKVIRASPPVIKTASSSSSGGGTGGVTSRSSKVISEVKHKTTQFQKFSNSEEKDASLESAVPPLQTTAATTRTRRTKVKSVILSDSIVERPIRSFPSPTTLNAPNDDGGNHPPKQSRFKSLRFKSSSQQQQQQGGGVVDGVGVGGGIVTPNGFPSLDRPVGSLVRRGGVVVGVGGGSKNNNHKNQQTKSATVNKQQSSKKEQFGTTSNTTTASAAAAATTTKTTTTTTTTNSIHSNSNNSNNEADAMLKSMTQSEIQDGIEEITSCLSSSTIAFLRQRGLEKRKQQEQQQQQQQKKKEQQKEKEKEEEEEQGNKKANDGRNESNKQKQTHEYNMEENKKQNEEEEEKQYQKKEKMAKLLSSIQTEDELEQAYIHSLDKDQQQQEKKPKEEEEEKEEDMAEVKEEDEMNKATMLLRSTSSHQRLLGAKLILQILQDYYYCPSTKEKGKEEKEHEKKTFIPPLLLPVSLICLLDDVASSSSASFLKQQQQQQQEGNEKKEENSAAITMGVVLLDVILRSLYLLLLLIVHPFYSVSVDINHVVVVTKGNNNDMKKESEERQKKIMSDNDVYQLYYMEDDVPIPSANTIYNSFQITPTTAPTKKTVDDNNNNNNGNIGADTSTNASSYATNASADTASSDSKAFYNDPLWILLSRMRILPCLSNILRCSAVSYHDSGKDCVGDDDDDDDDTSSLTNKNEKKGETKDPIASITSSFQKCNLPRESLSSICGILSMLSLRSPGAACAIAQHEYIVPLIVDSTLSPPSAEGRERTDTNAKLEKGTVGEIKEEEAEENDGFAVNTQTAYSALVMLCTLARQSRAVASTSKVFGRVIPYLQAILAIEAECEEEWIVQRWCIVLWRILLRYGLAIPHLSTFLSLSVPHITMSQPSKYSLATEYLSAFSNICECAKVVTRRSGGRGDGGSVQLLPGQRETLAMAGMWLSSHVLQCSSYLQALDNSSVSLLKSSSCDSFSVVDMRLACARIRILSSYIAAAGPIDMLEGQRDINETTGGKEESKFCRGGREEKRDDFVPVIPVSSCLLSLQALIKSGLLRHSMNIVLEHAFAIDWIDHIVITSEKNDSESGCNVALVQKEASACALVKDCLSLLSSCSGDSRVGGTNSSSDDDNHEVGDDEVKSLLMSLTTEIQCTILECLRERRKYKDVDVITMEKSLKRNDADVSLANCSRIRWLNSAHFAICKFLLSLQPSSRDISSLSIRKAFGYSLLGRLQRGDEAKAAIILSQDILFDVVKHPSTTIKSPSYQNESPIQSMLLKELCGTKLSQAQLDHSFKLQRGVGISASSGTGPFSLESLRMDVDRKDPPSLSAKSKKEDDSSLSSPVSELMIPLGKLWLWNILSSTIRPLSLLQENSDLGVIHESNIHQSNDMLQEAVGVVASCLQLLLMMEEDCELRNYYAGHINSGAKLYHLVNICLFPEEVLRDERIVPLLVTLFNMYAFEGNSAESGAKSIAQKTLHCQSFISACYLHSRSSQMKKKMQYSIYKSKTENNDDKTTITSLKTESGSNSISLVPHLTEMKSLEEFVGDMCDAYLEYGAQYDCFTQCIRYFLSPIFPSKVVTSLIQKLRGFLHLLTVEEESENLSGPAMMRSLHCGLSGGLPSQDGSKRDPAEILDSFAMALKGDDCHLSAAHGGYFYLLAVAFLARNLASSSQKCECGVQAMKRRMRGMNIEVLNHIEKTATLILSSKDGGKDDVVKAVLDSCIHKKDLDSMFDMSVWVSKDYDSAAWESMIASLQNITIDKNDAK